MAKTATTRRSSTPSRPPSEAQLTQLAETDQPALVALAAQYGIQPGRGITKSVMVKRILVATGQSAPAKKAPAKRTPAKKVGAKKTSAKKVATKKTTPRRLTVVTGRASSAPARSNGHVPEQTVRDFIEAAVTALEAAKSLL